MSHTPSSSFVAASWSALLLGIVTYLVGLWNANMQLNEKGYYLTILIYGLFAAISLQKSVRDQKGFYGMAYVSSLFAAVAVQKSVRDTAVGKLDLDH